MTLHMLVLSLAYESSLEGFQVRFCIMYLSGPILAPSP